MPVPGLCQGQDFHVSLFTVNGLAKHLVLKDMIMIDMCECEINFCQSYTFLLPMFHHRRSEETMRMMYPLYMGNSSHYHNLDGVPLLVNVSFMLNPSVWKLLWINNVFAGIQRFLSEQLVYQNNWCSVLILFFRT